MRSIVIAPAVVLVVVLLAALSGCKRSGTQAAAKSGANSGASSSANTGAAKPAITPAGTPLGSVNSATIGPDGDTLSSPDSRLTLSVPPGAFAADTEVSIAPVTNTAPNGVGLTYRFTPEGTTFAKPVTLAWQLSPNDLAGGSLDDFLVAAQTSDGKWMAQPGVKRDVATNTLSVSARHFSDWALLKTLVLKPGEAKVDVGKSVNFTPKVLYVDPALLATDSETTVPQLITLSDLGPNPVWAVDGKPNGDAVIGTIYEANHLGNYIAPGNVPAANPVSVSLSIQLGSRKLLAPAIVTIIGNEEWTGDSEITQLDGSQVSSAFTFKSDDSEPGVRLRHFDVEEGHAHWTPPKKAGNCRLTVGPTDHDIGPKEGNLTVQYVTDTIANITGGGTTVWLATYTTHCPDGSSKSFQAPASAAWWPVDPYKTSPIPVKGTQFTIKVDGVMGKGIVHLTRMH